MKFLKNWLKYSVIIFIGLASAVFFANLLVVLLISLGVWTVFVIVIPLVGAIIASYVSD